MLTLKALADMRADREDMRDLMDDIIRLHSIDRPSSSTTPPPPPVIAAGRRSARGTAAGPPALTPDDIRGRQPLGVDAVGCAYYWFDIPYDHDAPVGIMCSRLYVEKPPQHLKQQHLEDDGHHAAAEKPPLPPSRCALKALVGMVAVIPAANCWAVPGVTDSLLGTVTVTACLTLKAATAEARRFVVTYLQGQCWSWAWCWWSSG